jgi:hypothetical protein
MPNDQYTGTRQLEKELESSDEEGTRLNAKFVYARDRLLNWQNRHRSLQQQLSAARQLEAIRAK